MKPICIIPARGGSKGVIGKNFRILGDKPLITHAIETAIDSNLFSHVIVSTDNEKIAAISKKSHAEIPFIRPTELATETTTTDAVFVHAVEELIKQCFKFETVVMRDCTCPFIDKNDIKGALDLFHSSDCDAVYAAIKAHPNPYFGMGELNSNGYLITPKIPDKKITRRQDSPTVYDLDGMIIFNAKKFLQTKTLFSNKSLPYEISKEHGHMIDFEFDFKVAELLYKSNCC